MTLKSIQFIALLFISLNALATAKDSAYTYRFSVENHFGHSNLNFQLDSSWYFEKENYREHFVYNEFKNPSLKEELNIIQISNDFKLAEAGKSKIPSKILALNFKDLVKQFKSADYEQKMGYVQLDIPHKKAILNLKMLGIGKGFLLVYELHDQSTWMMWYPGLTEGKKELLKSREVNADKMILQPFVPMNNYPSKQTEKTEDSTEVEAEFKGGYESLAKFVQSTLEIPDSFIEYSSSQSNKYYVRVIMRFVVEKDGSLSDFFVENINDQLFPSAINACIKLYRQMPNWDAATRKGSPFRTLLYLPIKFEAV